jgi:hypothetical protein
MQFCRSVLCLALFAGLLVMSLGCADNSHVHSGNLIGVSLTPTSPTIAVGQTQTFNAMAEFSNGAASQDVTSTATWESSIPAVATISAGKATALTAGESTITVSYTLGSSTVETSTVLTVVASLSALREGTARVVFASAPDVPPSQLTIDGRVVGEVDRGSSFSLEVPSGIHQLVSPDGRHTFRFHLLGDATYTFRIAATGTMELADGRD